jgi:hypothetical protein
MKRQKRRIRYKTRVRLRDAERGAALDVCLCLRPSESPESLYCGGPQILRLRAEYFLFVSRDGFYSVGPICGTVLQ